MHGQKNIKLNSDTVSGYDCVPENGLFVVGFQSISDEITMT